MRHTGTRAPLEVRHPDEYDRRKCSACGVLVLDTIEEWHARKHTERRSNTSKPITFAFIPGTTTPKEKR